ncbi:MAG: hypothetical protein HY909_15705 [Deltaproteobacteria bacterium]|nr:hypothetical protein [Deltaproteobacteria bacterium]
MKPVPDLVRELTASVTAELRQSLEQRDRPWLVDEVIRLTLAGATLADILRIERDAQLARSEAAYLAETAPDREARAERVRASRPDERWLHLQVERFGALDRARFEADGTLRGAPPKGGALITSAQRSDAGNLLLRDAKDLLYALLFGGPALGVNLPRVERELLAVTIPRAKRYVMDFMMAVSELEVRGSWRDPKGSANDERADNIVMEVEYGEVASEAVGPGIAACLRVINDLEVNEVILYSRMTNIESSSL